MTDSQIYRKTLKFSLMNVACSLAGVACLVLLPVVGILVASVAGDAAMIVGAVVGLVLGVVANVLIGRLAGYLFKAGQIAMIAEAVSTGSLPDDAFAAGKRAVKARFGTVAAYAALMAAIRGITSAITSGVNKLTSAIDDAADGNSAVGVVGSAVSIVIDVVLEYVNYCSLGWVFAHKDENPFKSTCDGAVIYFQNWKTLLKNTAKIIGVTALSLVVIGGPFFLLFRAVLGAFPHVTSALSELDGVLETDAGTCLLGASAICALVIWNGLHSAFVQPVILISVMRRYIEAGTANPPKVDVYGTLAGISDKFRATWDKAKEQGGLPADGAYSEA